MGISLDSIKDKMIGKTFGKLTIKKYGGKSERGDNLWRCICECGAEVVGRTANVDKPNSGCKKCKRATGAQAEERRTFLLGRTFGRLTVLSYDGSTKYNAGMWRCRCECGNEISTRTSNLLLGTTQSCGCYARERASQANTTHGLHDHPLYQVWYKMKDRCYNPNNAAYHRYGLRGIRVCEDWLSSFLVFYSWAISKGYQSGLSIERTDNNGNYEPGNCVWATDDEQSQNTSRTRMNSDMVIRIRKDTRPYCEIASEYGVDESTISRIANRQTWKNII